MLLYSKDGILCDHCGSEHRDVFVYYSVSGQEISVRTSRQFTQPGSKVLDLDLCPDCYQKWLERAGEALTKLKKPGILLGCELSGVNFYGNYIYIQLILDEVSVDRDDPSGPKVKKNAMDLKIGSEVLEEFKTKMQEIRAEYAIQNKENQ